jgi:hypothetical protein
MSNFQKTAVFIMIAMGTSAVFCFAVAEIGIRIWKSDVAFQPDPDLIRSLRPNIAGDLFSYETRENLSGRSNTIPATPLYFGITKTNNLGLRMLEDVDAKRADEKRVLIFGDSYTEAIQIDASKRFADLADAKLADATDGRWRIINAGIMNGNPEQYLLMLRGLGKSVEPDLVVIILAPNDLEDSLQWNSRYGFERDEAGVPLRPKTRGWLALTRYSFAMRYFYAFLEVRSPAGLEFFFPSAEPELQLEKYSWKELVCSMSERSVESFRERTGPQLSMLREMSAEFGADFAVLGIHYQYYFPHEPYYEARFPDLPAALAKEGCMKSRGAEYEAFLWEFMASQSIPLATIYDRFVTAKAANPSRKLWHFYDYHFSRSGHELVAQELFDLVRSRIEVSSTATADAS